MPTVETFIASGVTALGLSLLFLYFFLTEKIVPKGRLDEKNVDLDYAKAALKDALAIIKQQNDGVEPMLKTLINRRQQ